jgi:hypothetical protein
MTTQQRVLEYNVDRFGAVTTSGQYQVITQADWHAAREHVPHQYAAYAALWRDLRAGKVLALVCRDHRHCLHRRAHIRQQAPKQQLHVEMKITDTLGDAEGHFLLVRCVPENENERR